VTNVTTERFYLPDSDYRHGWVFSKLEGMG